MSTTPTREQVRHAYADGLSGTSRTRPEVLAEFDRWLDAHDATTVHEARVGTLVETVAAWPTFLRDMVSRGYVRGWLTDRLKAAMEESRP